MWVGIVEKNILQDWTEGTQNISVSLEWYLIITDQCYISETVFCEHISQTWGFVGEEVLPLESINMVRHLYVHSSTEALELTGWDDGNNYKFDHAYYFNPRGIKFWWFFTLILIYRLWGMQDDHVDIDVASLWLWLWLELTRHSTGLGSCDN